MRTVVYVFASIIYWWVALTIGGLVSVLMGDCGTAQEGLKTCAEQKRIFAFAVIFVAALG